MGILEGLTSAVGEELSKWTGFRSTRVTTAQTPDVVIDSGTLTASSADGVVVTLGGGDTFHADVAAGYRFRLQTDALTNVITSGTGTGSAVFANHPNLKLDLDTPPDVGAVFRLTTGTLSASVRPGHRLLITSGALNGESALINRITDDGDVWLQCPWLSSIDTAFDWEIVTDLVLEDVRVLTRDSNTQITLEDIGLDVAFTSQSWQILEPVSTSLDVETTLDWPEPGLTRLGDGRLYHYESITSTTLDDLRPDRHHGRTGRIVVVGQASIADGETFTIDDGFGSIRTFEFFEESLTYEVGPAVRGIELATGASAGTVRDLVIDAINAEFRLLRAFAYDTDVVGLWHMVAGGVGWIHCTETVANAGFVTDGPRGLEDSVAVLDEVPDDSGTYSGIGQTWRGMMLRYADGEDLDYLGRALGVPRILGLDDDRYREYLKALAYRARHTEDALEASLAALYGYGRYEVFSDHTFGSIRTPNQIFVRRNNGNETDFHGKLFLDEAAVGARNALTVTLAEEPTAVGRVTQARDPVRLRYDAGGTLPTDIGADYRLIDVGSGASYVHSTGRVTLASGSFNGYQRIGDLFIFTKGMAAHKQGRIVAKDGGNTWIDLAGDGAGLILEHPLQMLSANAGPHDWMIVRDIASCYRQTDMSLDIHEERPGVIATSAWALAGGGGAVATSTVDEYGEVLTLTDGAAGNTTLFSRGARIDRGSRVQVFARVQLDDLGATGATAIDRRQFMLAVHCAELDTVVRLGIEDATDKIIGILDAADDFTGYGDDYSYLYWYDTGRTGKHMWLTIGLEVDFSTYRLSDGRVYARYWANGAWRGGDWHDSGTTADTKIEWGSGSTNTNTSVRVKWVDWQVENTRDWGNTLGSGAWTSSSANPTRITAPSAIFVAADDDLGVEKRVRVKQVGAVNSAGGAMLGEWVVDTYVSTTVVSLAGPIQQGASAIYGPGLTDGDPDPADIGYVDAAAAPVQLFQAADLAFRWPHHKGCSIEILTGPNAGTYVISDFRKADTLEAAWVGHADGYFSAPADLPLEYIQSFFRAGEETHTVQLATALPDPNARDMTWRLIPNFPTDTAIVAERVQGSTVAAAVVTFPETPPASVSATALLEAEVVHSRSGYLEVYDRDELIIAGSSANASSTDGLTVSVGASALSGVTVTPGMFIFVIDPDDNTNVGMARIASSTANDVTVESPGFGAAFTDGTWEIWALQATQYVGGAWTREGGYIADNYGYWVREALKRNMAAGYKLDFDGLFRAEYDGLVNGLRLMEDVGP